MRHYKVCTVISAVLIIVLSLSACGKAGNDFVCADVADRSPSQQVWLKSPQSELVINPDAVNSASDTPDSRDMSCLPLSFGITDGKGNIVRSYNDAFFLLEAAAANAIGGEVLYEDTYDTAKGLSKCLNESSGKILDFTIPSELNDTVIGVKPALFTADILNPLNYFVINVTAVPENGKISVCPNIRAERVTYESVLDINAPGVYVIQLFSLQDKLEITGTEGGNKMSLVFEAQGAGRYSLSASVQQMREGYSQAEAAPSCEWTPYCMRAELVYKQGTALNVADWFFGKNAITRRIASAADGSFAMCGKIYGSVSYDVKTPALCFTDGDVSYVIMLKRKIPPVFYKSFEDLLSGTEPSDSADGASYWAVPINNFEYSENESSAYCVAVAASMTQSTDELLSENIDAVSPTKNKNILPDLEEFWNTYIAENDVSAYIINVPEK